MELDSQLSSSKWADPHHTNVIDKEKGLAWKFILATNKHNILWDLSRAVFKILRDGEFWRSQVNKRQDVINKLRAENKKLMKEIKKHNETL